MMQEKPNFELDELVSYLDGDRDNVWKTMLLFEREGIDVGAMASELHAYLTHPTLSPLPNASSLTSDEERDIVLSLRERARHAIGAPALSRSQADNWQYKIPHIVQRAEVGEILPNPSAAETSELIRELGVNRPDLIEALSAVSEFNMNARLGERLADNWILSAIEQYLIRKDMEVSLTAINRLAWSVIFKFRNEDTWYD